MQKVCKSCRSREELSNEYVLCTCKNRLRTAKNEPFKVCWYLQPTLLPGHKYRSGDVCPSVRPVVETCLGSSRSRLTSSVKSDPSPRPRCPAPGSRGLNAPSKSSLVCFPFLSTRSCSIWTWVANKDFSELELRTSPNFRTSFFVEIANFTELQNFFQQFSKNLNAAFWENPKKNWPKFSKKSAKFWRNLQNFAKKQQKIQQFLTKKLRLDRA